jgi:membrane-bound lytic murein transglycosylase D
VDERLDPFKSTVAAARLLEQNRSTTGSWPLAITAYNHGAAGVRRAVRKLGTHDIATIVRKYRSRTFGFASRNFYLEFLAAADVDFHSEKYFGPLLMDLPVEYLRIELPYFTNATALHRALGVDLEVLMKSNPGLRPSVWSGAKYVPRGYAIRVPRSELARPLESLVEEIPESARFAAQQRDTFHVVRRGETLSKIAGRYGVRVSEVVALNGLRSRHRIRAGQKLRLPDVGRSRKVSASSKRRAPIAPSLPPSDGKYVVRRGDTLARIADRFGIDQQELIRANQLRNRNRIYEGQILALALDAAPAEEARDPHPHAVVTVSKPESTEPAEAKGEEGAPSPPSPGVFADDLEGSSGAPVEMSPALVADPSDYSVGSDGAIEVQAAETLGHYAEWLGIRASRLRRINRLDYGEPLVIGRELDLDFSAVTPEEFERRRIEYHRGLQGEFFDRFEIHGTQVHVMRRGDSLWVLSQRKYRVPLWLIRQYNPDLDFAALHPGTRVTIPLLRPHNGSGAAVDPVESGSEGEAVQREASGDKLG